MNAMRWISGFLAAGCLSVLALACGGEGEVGEDCDTPGATDECVEGAVCDSTEGEAVLCLALCEEQEDCAADESCNGVSGSNLKACHPKEEDDTKK